MAYCFQSFQGGKVKHGQPETTSLKDWSCSYHLGSNAFELGDFKTSRDYLEFALHEAKEIGNKSSEGTVYNDLGVAYLSGLSDVKKAIEFLHLSLPIAKETEDKGLEGTVYNNLGSAFDSLGDVKKAIGFFI